MNRERSTRPGLVVLCPLGIRDHLVEPLMLAYLFAVQGEQPEHDALFITEEPGDTTLPHDLAGRLTRARITWLPLRYDPKAPGQWRVKLANGWRMFRAVRRFLRYRPTRHVVGYLAPGGSYATLLGMRLRCRTTTVCYEPHSLYMRELGIWRRGGPKDRLVGAMERLQVRRQDVLIVPTTAVRAHALALGRTKPTPMQGITIEVAAARFDPHAREAFRADHGIGDATVFTYAGKFGGLYHSVEQYMRFMVRVQEAIPGAHHLIITHPEWIAPLRTHPLAERLAGRLTIVPPVPPDQLPKVLSAADLGVVAIPPTPSQAFRTPVKSAFYWAAGLPIIIPRGVSDDHAIASAEDVGVVVDDLPTLDPRVLRDTIDRYRATDPEVLRQRCMDTAMRHRDTARMVEVLRKALA